MTALLAFAAQAVYGAPTRPGVVNPHLTRVLLAPGTRSVAVTRCEHLAPVQLSLNSDKSQFRSPSFLPLGRSRV
ncbi:MAG: hypothetical protein ACJ78K_03790, partial [Gemmatimonadaceae bacterium]